MYLFGAIFAAGVIHGLDREEPLPPTLFAQMIVLWPYILGVIIGTIIQTVVGIGY